MSDLVGRYFDAAITHLRRVRTEEADTIEAAAALLAEAVAEGRRIFTFGSGHSSLAAQDIVYRAGGLVPVNLLDVPGMAGVTVMPAPLSSALERVSGLATATLDLTPATSGDLLFVISLSGRQVMPVELARHARDRGLKVIGVTSLAYPEQVPSAHPSGTYLKDHCDVVLDNKIAVGDGELTHPAAETSFGPVSTIVTSALMQAVVASAVGRLADAAAAGTGATPPLFRSGNVPGGTEWNAKQMADNADRVFYTY
ncbi:SIS domain-containing protein [Streptomyces sp. CB01881]|uniref:SIS domain-containing protein n=1 Tax=Streptomyces sp. CB01881 TaxID=2078691 RepID=UPI000CDBC3D1|nr:SIS domain-containing protein [Streptomyces sp. CB01881]AUY50218.1 SIS domain-containing protein [Streptomyces sp. CB01881]TYC73609.1 sugar isomerase domain-containing protein [Streptomyces sp. CB01881]